jgi:hypothetical protein
MRAAMKRWLVLAFVLLSCSGSHAVRDYAKEATIYARLCRDGSGDLAACRKLLDAARAARGVDPRGVPGLAEAMCEHDDPIGCFHYQRTSGKIPPEREERIIARLEQVEKQGCQASDMGACEMEVIATAMGGIAGDRSSERDARERERFASGCRLGVLFGCAMLLEEPLRRCGDDRNPAWCLAVRAATWLSESETDELFALNRLQAACDAADAEACAFLPGRALDDAMLCAANDYDACAARGCAGDAAARATAKAHGWSPDCDSLHARRHH